MIHNIGKTTYRRYLDLDHSSHTLEIAVQQVEGTVAAHFVAAMQIDADGEPRGYHEQDVDAYSNKKPCFDWVENPNPNDRHGHQGQNGAIGPAPGFTISGTSLQDKTKAVNNTARYVDASTVPYIVLPTSFPVPAGATDADVKDWLGCLAYVVDLKSGHAAGAVFADVGPRVGESSIALALRLCRNPFSKKYHPKVTGIDSKRFFYIVFPNDRMTMPLAIDQIEIRAKTLFEAWGGWAAVAVAIKQVPQEQPHIADDDNIHELVLPPAKGPCPALDVQTPAAVAAAIDTLSHA